MASSSLTYSQYQTRINIQIIFRLALYSCFHYNYKHIKELTKWKMKLKILDIGDHSRFWLFCLGPLDCIAHKHFSIIEVSNLEFERTWWRFLPVEVLKDIKGVIIIRKSKKERQKKKHKQQYTKHYTENEHYEPH